MVLRAFRAEVLKLRRTLILWTIFAGSMLLPLLFLAAFITLWPVDDPQWQLATDYLTLRDFWSGLFLPLLIILQMGLLGNLENQPDQWKYLFALPVPRGALFIAKWLVGTLSAFTCAAVFGVVYVLTQVIINVFVLGLSPFDLAVPLGKIAADMVVIAIAVFLMLTIHLWFSLHTKSLVTNFGVSIVVVILNLGFIWSRGATHLFPWSLGSNAVMLYHGSLTQTLLLSVLGGLAVGLIGCRVFTRRDVSA
jgi:lantibiotic transport system permease protein